MNEILYADDLVSVSESMENLSDKFLKWKETFESKMLTVHLKKTKVMVNSSKEKFARAKLIHVPCVARR